MIKEVDLMNPLKQIYQAVVMTAVFTVLLGILYPLVVTILAGLLFPQQAHGSLIEKSGTVIGSRLIGQLFRGPGYFHPRPSAAGHGYDASASSGSNLGPASRELIQERVNTDALKLLEENQEAPIPVDLITTSASGLDPHISPAAAEYQVPRVARERGVSPAIIRKILGEYIEGRQFGLLGEPRVNVLELNLALDSTCPLTVESAGK